MERSLADRGTARSAADTPDELLARAVAAGDRPRRRGGPPDRAVLRGPLLHPPAGRPASGTPRAPRSTSWPRSWPPPSRPQSRAAQAASEHRQAAGHAASAQRPQAAATPPGGAAEPLARRPPRAGHRRDHGRRRRPGRRRRVRLARRRRGRRRDRRHRPARAARHHPQVGRPGLRARRRTSSGARPSPATRSAGSSSPPASPAARCTSRTCGPVLEHILAARLAESHAVNLYTEPDAARQAFCRTRARRVPVAVDRPSGQALDADERRSASDTAFPAGPSPG